MDDDNIVAYIYPAVGTQGYVGAAHSIETNAANPGYLLPRRRRPQVLEARHRGPSDIFNRHERELTVDEEEHDDLEYEAGIKVTFDHIPKTRFGLRTGRSDDAELRLVELPGVGFYHFALTFDDNYCLVVRDLGSTCGTTVIYDRTVRGRWSNFDWIVGGSDFLEGVSRIIVKVSQFLQFQLVIPRHDIKSKSYKDKVDRFRAGTADTEQLLDLGHVGLWSRVRTAVPSGVQTPVSQPATAVTVSKKIGQGTFAVVCRVMNVSTGEQYALKKPKPGTALANAAAWEREALIMDRINHKHIVSLLNSRPGPAPWLHLKYIPGGSVGDHLKAGRCFSDYERKQIFAQTADGLAYLHTLDPQIVHRDVKPNNILIEYRRPDAIFVVFADFGLSREGDALKTICGTCLYLAPEVYEAAAILRAKMTPYTALVDIWSLGVVLTELVCGLPEHEKEQSMGVGWCQSVRQRVERMPGHGQDDLLSFVLESMLCLRPDARKPATDCHKEALLLLDRTRESNSEESNSGASGDHCLDSFESEAFTIRLGEGQKLDSESGETGSSDLSIGSSSPSRYIVSDAGRDVRSCNAPSPEATRVDVGQLLSKFRDPEDSLFYNPSFGEDSDDSSSDGEGSGSASTIVIAHDVKPQDEQDGGSSEPKTDDLEDRLLESPLREMLTNGLKAMAEETGTCTGIEADATLSVKRSRAARSPRPMPPVDSVEKRTKRNKTVRYETGSTDARDSLLV